MGIALCGWPRLRAGGVAGVSLRIPCDGCGSCGPCPYGVAITQCFGFYNDAVSEGRLPDTSRVGTRRFRRDGRRFLAGYHRAIDQFAQADRCIGCRQCEARCPRRLPVVAYLRQIEALTELLAVEGLKRASSIL